MNYVTTEPVTEWLVHSAELETIVKQLVPREVLRMDQDLRQQLKRKVDEQAKINANSDTQINQCFADNQLPGCLNALSCDELPPAIT